jgi:hypothetical protein
MLGHGYSEHEVVERISIIKKPKHGSYSRKENG